MAAIKTGKKTAKKSAAKLGSLSIRIGSDRCINIFGGSGNIKSVPSIVGMPFHRKGDAWRIKGLLVETESNVVQHIDLSKFRAPAKRKINVKRK